MLATPRVAKQESASHQVRPQSSVDGTHPTITVGVAKFTIGEHVRIRLLNVFRGMSTVWLEDYVIIDSFNWISANPLYQQLDPEAGTLFHGHQVAGW
jgi:archaellum biogenesis ATPase FlaH